MQTNVSGRLGILLKSLLSLLVGAFVPALVIAAISIMSLVRTRGADLNAPPEPGAYLQYLLSSGGIVFLFAIVFTIAHAFILGGPVAFLMMRFRLIRWWTCLLAGFLIGMIPMALVTGYDFMNALLVGGGLGAVGGFTAWLVWHFWVERGAARKTPVPGG